jgi:hypothetical protein
MKLRMLTVRLFLEEVFKLLPRVQGSRRNAFRRRRWPRGRRGRRSILFNGGSKLIKRTFVALIFSRHRLGNRLHAFEAGGAVKKSALLAAMKFERATRTFALRIKARLQYGAAVRTARASDRADHSWRARSYLFLSWVAFMRTFIFFLGLVGMLVAPMFILPVQGNLRWDAQSIF